MLLTKSGSEHSNQKLKKRCRKMADELEKEALNDILRTALFIVTRLDELEAKIDQCFEITPSISSPPYKNYTREVNS